MNREKIEQIKTYLVEKRLAILIAYLLLSAVTVILITTVDIRLSWLLIILLPAMSLNIYIYQDQLISNENWKDRVELISLSFFIASLLIIFIMLFLSITVLFGLIIPFYLIIQHWYFYKEIKIPMVTNKDKIIFVYGAITTFITILVLFIIPIYIANDGTNPRAFFSGNYDVVDSYPLYYDTGETDREHVIAQSWFPNSEGNFVNDFINVIWSNKNVNGARGNLIFNNVPKNNLTEIIRSNNVVGYKQGGYFMPLDAYKGDVARILLYMYVTYKDDGLPLEYINLDLLKSWSRLDPVDKKERDRNDLIKQTYGYNNKFVSTPWLIVFVV